MECLGGDGVGTHDRSLSRAFGYLRRRISVGDRYEHLDFKEASTLGPKAFAPSINWSAAPINSLRWVAIAWVISAVCLIAVLFVFRYLTPWGRQFWRITRGYFVGAHSVRVWLMLGVLLLSVLLSVRLMVLLSYQ